MRFRRGRIKTGGRTAGTPNRTTVDVRGLARGLVDNKSYLDSLGRRLRSGSAGSIEALIWHYAFGKPLDRMSISTLEQEPAEPQRDLSKLSLEELELLRSLLLKIEVGALPVE